MLSRHGPTWCGCTLASSYSTTCIALCHWSAWSSTASARPRHGLCCRQQRQRSSSGSARSALTRQHTRPWFASQSHGMSCTAAASSATKRASCVFLCRTSRRRTAVQSSTTAKPTSRCSMPRPRICRTCRCRSTPNCLACNALHGRTASVACFPAHARPWRCRTGWATTLGQRSCAHATAWQPWRTVIVSRTDRAGCASSGHCKPQRNWPAVWSTSRTTQTTGAGFTAATGTSRTRGRTTRRRVCLSHEKVASMTTAWHGFSKQLLATTG